MGHTPRTSRSEMKSSALVSMNAPGGKTLWHSAMLICAAAASLFLGGCVAETFEGITAHTPAELRSMSQKAYREQKHDEAIKLLTQAADMEPDNYAVRMNLVLMLRRLKRYEEEWEQLKVLFESDLFMNGTFETAEGEIWAEEPGANKTDLVRNRIMQRWMKRGGSREQAIFMRPNLKRGEEIYFAKCSNKCHQPEGWGLKDGKYPQIAGQHSNITIKQLADIREKNRDNPEMYRFALPAEVGGVQAIADVSAYIETLLMTPDSGQGPGNNLEMGKSVYGKYCLFCHGPNGEGHATLYYPRIQGQHYEYMRRQIRWMKEGKRRNIHPLKTIQFGKMSDDEINASLDYISRMQPDEKMRAEPGWTNPDAKEADNNSLEGEGLF